MNQSRIEQLWEESQSVLQDCALPNGAIVAANTDLLDYPATAENYRFVWGRDNAFQLVAAKQLEIPRAADIRSNYLGWLANRAEGFSATGLVVKRYSTNGNLDWRYGVEYQPDQAGALLWALTETQEDDDKRTKDIVTLLARGITKRWDRTNFHTQTQDLWENTLTDPAQGDNFTYSLAASAYGLGRAVSYLDGKTQEADLWQETSDEMNAILNSEQATPHYLKKIYTDLNSNNGNYLDASLDGLIYPFPAGHSSESIDKRVKTVIAIGELLCELPNGVLRYQRDTYDGIVRTGGFEDIAGRWPLLTFWHVIAQNRVGHTASARELYGATIERLDDLYKSESLPNNQIPEQLFTDDGRQGKGVLPLAWSHAMFALATKELGLK